MKRVIVCGSLLAAVAANLAGSAQPQNQDSIAANCAALAGSKAFAKTEVTRAAIVPAANNLPSYCEVQGVIRPVKGSEIGVVYRLPANWNSKVLALGGGARRRAIRPGAPGCRHPADGVARAAAAARSTGPTRAARQRQSHWGRVAPAAVTARPAQRSFQTRALSRLPATGSELDRLSLSGVFASSCQKS
jgi:hypothetical protein